MIADHSQKIGHDRFNRSASRLGGGLNWQLYCCNCALSADSWQCVVQIEAGRLAAVSKQLKVLKAEQFKKGQQLFGLKGQEQELASDINGGHAQNRNLSHQLRKLDEKVRLACLWPARYNAWLLIKLTSKCVVFSFLFLI